MIARLHGLLESIEGSAAWITPGGGVTYHVLLPSFTAARLGQSIGQEVTLHTFYFLESTGQGSTIFPRLAGFLSPQDRAFYELFVTCKGIGHRRALRAMTLSSTQIAGAIADRDLALLQSLPEVGKRTAETIAVTLRGKVDAFLTASPGISGPVSGSASVPGASGSMTREALDVLVQLGENRAQALQWIDRVMGDDDPPGEVQSLVAACFTLKAGQ